jgi:oxygen-independent coproporphyrinogen-3 oxidase
MSVATPLTGGRSSPASLRVLPAAPEGATTIGGLFVANYPPFPFWSPEALPEVERRLQRPPDPATPLGVYVHIPFCRKRCRFCYYKVYTEQSAAEVNEYVDAVLREVEMTAPLPAFAGRRPRFVYFGGGTPSYLSSSNIDRLMSGLRRALPWDHAEEVTFECEPGTISEAKLRALKEAGVTRLSLGVENFAPEVLTLNGRAHQQRQIYQAYEAARTIGLPQINIDLISGLLGESDEGWADNIRRTIELAPDSVTIYQMEVPGNSTIARELRAAGLSEVPAAPWQQKRAWIHKAFAAFEAAGYRLSSGYTMVRGEDVTFRYRDSLWHGADMLALGVSSFGHLGGVHFQNEKEIESYVARVRAGERPLSRGYALTTDERLVREFILQLKLGVLGGRPFREKFGVDVFERFAVPIAALVSEGLATIEETSEDTRLRLSRDALLQVDTLLPAFYLPHHR